MIYIYTLTSCFLAKKKKKSNSSGHCGHTHWWKVKSSNLCPNGTGQIWRHPDESRRRGRSSMSWLIRSRSHIQLKMVNILFCKRPFWTCEGVMQVSQTEWSKVHIYLYKRKLEEHAKHQSVTYQNIFWNLIWRRKIHFFAGFVQHKCS